MDLTKLDRPSRTHRISAGGGHAEENGRRDRWRSRSERRRNGGGFGRCRDQAGLEDLREPWAKPMMPLISPAIRRASRRRRHALCELPGQDARGRAAVSGALAGQSICRRACAQCPANLGSLPRHRKLIMSRFASILRCCCSSSGRDGACPGKILQGSRSRCRCRASHRLTSLLKVANFRGDVKYMGKIAEDLEKYLAGCGDERHRPSRAGVRL